MLRNTHSATLNGIMTVLTKAEIRRLVESPEPLLEGFADLDAQLQPNGFDLSLRDVFLYSSSGTITRSNKDRRLSDLVPLAFDDKGGINLSAGIYSITYNEVVSLPHDLTAFGFPRSSLLRCGATIYTAVWDAGYSGRSQSLLAVLNPDGIRLEKNARLLQLAFLKLSSATEGYDGLFQHENK